MIRNFCNIFLFSVEISRNRSRANIHMRSDNRITQKTKMFHQRLFAELRPGDLSEIPDFGIIGDIGPGPQPAKGPDLAMPADADIILDELLTKMGYRGESIGEKLKRVEKGDFVTLDDAWEAHKVRNRIAHETDNVLTHEQAVRAVSLFEKGLRELQYLQDEE